MSKENENDLVVLRSEKTLTEQYKQTMSERRTNEQISNDKKRAHYEALEADVKPEWDNVQRKLDEIRHTVMRAYESPWSRLIDLLTLLDEAWAKQGRIDRARFADAIAPCSTNFTSTVASAAGGLVGGVLGGVGGLFGLGNGFMAGANMGAQGATAALGAAGGLVGGAGAMLGLGGSAAAGSNYILGKSAEGVGYYVDMNEDGGVDYWLHRLDGQELTTEEIKGYKADVDCWLKQQGYVQDTLPWRFKPESVNTPPLDAKRFAALRDNPQTGLNSYFAAIKNKQQLAFEFKQDEADVIQTPSMRM